ncbi:ATP-binding protein [Streptomyces carminius]|uniref:ATP-binding protein n=1 Tax=Streptomyces carminius TaxID=2665496 RepID=UPI001E36F79C|nr:tetratricopeptide repeat protein [Streptomyces carminius]
MSGGVHFHGPGAPDPHRSPPPRQLPGSPRKFVNRADELERLDALLVPDGGDGGDGAAGVSVCVVAGTPGAGKTSLALRWAHRVKDRFPDGQLYVNLRGYDPREPVTAHQALHHFLTGLGVPAGAVPADAEAAAALYRSLLADRGVLVVLDNAATVEQVRPLLPGNPRCLVLVTSRGRLSGLAVRDGAERITLGTLPEDEAVALLRAITAGYRAGDDPERLTELARLCARLPLALRIAAERAAGSPYTGLDDLIADLRDESALWDVLSTGDDAEADAVRTVFAWSYRALPEAAARVFRLLGLHPGPEVGLGAAAALAGVTARRARQVLDTLVGAHLLEQTAPDRYEFHDLLRAYATDQARSEEPPEGRSAALRRLLDWYLHTARAAGERIASLRAPAGTGRPDEGVVPMSFSDYDQAVDWAEREHANLLAAVRAAERSGLDRHARLLTEVLFAAQAPSAPAADWITVADAGLAAARRLGDRPGEATLLHCLGFAHRQLNHLTEAARCHERSLAVRRELGDEPGEAEALNALGLVCLRGRRLDRAEERFDRAIGIFRRLGAVRRELVALANRAETRHAAGRPDRAAADLDGVLPAHRAAGEKALLGNALRVRSLIRLESGSPRQALDDAAEAVELALELRDHTLEGYWLIALGDAQRALGRYGDALASYHRSALLHRRLGDRSREALAWQGAGETYLLMRRPAEAADFHRRAAAVHAELGDDWHHALALDARARALADEDPALARALRQRAVRLLAPYGDDRAARVRRRLGGDG